MKSPSVHYVFGGNQIERDRLLVQAEDYKPEAIWLLDQIGIEPGWRAGDIGCGPIGILDLLSERVGGAGAVVGVEREPRFAEMANAEVARRGLANVAIVEGDALSAELPIASFDFVHERLVLVNMPPENQKAFVAQMVSLARPGGIVALENVDRASFVCHPEHPSMDILSTAFREAVRPTNGEGTAGRTLPWLLRSAGVSEIRTKVHVRVLELGERRRTFFLDHLDLLRPKILAQGLLTEAHFDLHRAALAEHFANSDTLLIDRLFVQSWGRKPRAEMTG